MVRPEVAPRPSTWAERFVFAHAYETLVRVDCNGQPTAGLAKSWTPIDANTRWRVVLRNGARFWNGDVVTAGDVIASWRATARMPTAVLARRLAERTTVVDDSTLDIALSDASLNTLGDAELAVVRRTPQSRWPDGTGSYRIREVGGRSGEAAPMSALLLESVGGATHPRLMVHTVLESDARDIVDAGADLVVTEDPSLASYAASRPGVSLVPLSWDRTWVLVSPMRASLAADSVSAETTSARTLALRSALARDAVRADARPSTSVLLSAQTRCVSHTVPEPRPRSERTGSRIVYQRDEPVARALAERLVALAATARGDSALALVAPELARGGARATTAGLAPNDFNAALRGGNELSFIVAVPIHATAPCGTIESLFAAAPWLGPDAAGRSIGGSMSPLIDTRPRAIARQDRISLTFAWDNTLIVGPVPRSAGGPP